MAEHSISVHDALKSNYRKIYIPLESNPEIFNPLLTKLGVETLEFQDVLSMSDPELLGFVPRPVLGLILNFFPSHKYQASVREEEAKRAVYAKSGEDEPVFWIAQTIHNACGLYGFLHAVMNGNAKKHIAPGSILDRLQAHCVPLLPEDRALALENSTEVERVYEGLAVQGQTQAPALNEDVEYHYVCFTAGVNKDGELKVYEMDGVKKGPIETEVILETEDLLSENVMAMVQRYLDRCGKNLHCSLMALVIKQ